MSDLDKSVYACFTGNNTFAQIVGRPEGLDSEPDIFMQYHTKETPLDENEIVFCLQSQGRVGHRAPGEPQARRTGQILKQDYSFQNDDILPDPYEKFGDFLCYEEMYQEARTQEQVLAAESAIFLSARSIDDFCLKSKLDRKYLLWSLRENHYSYVYKSCVPFASKSDLDSKNPEFLSGIFLILRSQMEYSWFNYRIFYKDFCFLSSSDNSVLIGYYSPKHSAMINNEKIKKENEVKKADEQRVKKQASAECTIPFFRQELKSLVIHPVMQKLQIDDYKLPDAFNLSAKTIPDGMTKPEIKLTQIISALKATQPFLEFNTSPKPASDKFKKLLKKYKKQILESGCEKIYKALLEK